MGAERVVESLYERLRARGFRYNLEEWHAEAGQRIREARVLHRHSGTCLDVALVFAAMCKDAGLRPYLVILGSGTKGQADHAMVMVDLASDAKDLVAREPGVRTRRSAEPHVYERRGLTPTWLDGSACVVVDVAQALVAPDRPQGAHHIDACAAGERKLMGDLYGFAVLVDVIPLHASTHPELGAPDENSRPTIYPKLRSAPSAHVYGNQRAALAELSGQRGVVAVHGASGVGKSVLANELARLADDGCGWFLDATDRSALTASLAEAELAQLGGPAVGQLDSVDLVPFAEAARHRLETAPGPWVVVLDNADGSPDDLGRLPVPNATLGQLLLITTTNPAWKARVESFFSLRPMADDEVRAAFDSEVDDRVRAALGGRALMIDASRRFGDTTERNWWDGRSPGDVTTAPEQFWHAVSEAEPDLMIRRVARAIAWLPPVPVGMRALGEALCADVEEAVLQLDALGLVTLDRRANTVLMHRLFRTAVRRHTAAERAEHGAVIVALLGAEPVRALLSRLPDRTSLKEMYDAVDPVPDNVQIVHSLAMLMERHDAKTAAGWYSKMIELADGEPDDDMRRRLSDAWRGKARYVLRLSGTLEGRAKREALDEGLAAAAAALDLVEGRDSWADRLAASRVEAMVGVLQRGRAGAETDRVVVLELLREAERKLRHSAEERRRLYVEDNKNPEDAPDVDRAEFNLGGLEVVLAQHDPANAETHLDAAEQVYRRVGQLRVSRYGTEELEECVSCVHGEALVSYYRAVLLPGSREKKVAHLRRAAELAFRATSTRAAVAGAFDSSDTAKSLLLSTKIALARHALRTARTAADYVVPDDVSQFADRELHLMFAQPEPPDGSDFTRKVIMRTEFETVPQVGSSGDIVADITTWLVSPPVAELVRAFEGDPTHLAEDDVDLADRLAWFHGFTDRWDTRIDPLTGRPRERNEATELVLTQAQEALVPACAHALGMQQAQKPRHAEYDHVVILGGLLRACINRPHYAAKLIDDGTVATRSLVALGGHRGFKGDEFDLARQAGHPDLNEEYEALDRGTRIAFRLGEPESVEGEESELLGGTWGVRRYRTESGVRVAVAAAPSSDPEHRRANTPDSYAWFATQFAKLIPGQRILAVTTPIYVPAQHAAALRMLALPYGVEVDTVGYDPTLMPAALDQPFSPTKYLLEIRSTVHALRGLLDNVRGR
ncbi:ATP-binding protein [Saccharothrix carnea]|uniref:ATP-binding protein n=1 Tax=Saccharothrix carnea TaxID=1280637 RepID=UPI0011B2680E|nr:ATP-binding protein [Saccharothrix carnea]